MLERSTMIWYYELFYSLQKYNASARLKKYARKISKWDGISNALTHCKNTTHLSRMSQIIWNMLERSVKYDLVLLWLCLLQKYNASDSDGSEIEYLEWSICIIKWYDITNDPTHCKNATHLSQTSLIMEYARKVCKWFL